MMHLNWSAKYKSNILKLVLPDVNNIYPYDTCVGILRISISITLNLFGHWSMLLWENIETYMCDV